MSTGHNPNVCPVTGDFCENLAHANDRAEMRNSDEYREFIGVLTSKCVEADSENPEAVCALDDLVNTASHALEDTVGLQTYYAHRRDE